MDVDVDAENAPITFLTFDRRLNGSQFQMSYKTPAKFVYHRLEDSELFLEALSKLAGSEAKNHRPTTSVGRLCSK